MKITAIAPWFGSKRILAPLIVRQLGEHRAYWEPFCGSMATLLAKPEVSQETVNDLHGDLVNLALVIQHAKWGPWLYRQLRRTLVHESLFRRFSADLLLQPTWPEIGPSGVGEADAKRAYLWFVCSWLGRNGVSGTREYNNSFCVRYTRNGGIQGTRFASAFESIPAWRRRLSQVTILRRDAFQLLERIDDQSGTAIYCDPPYLSKGATYIHDFNPDQHGYLALLLRRFQRARVVVSYYEHEQLASLYPGWTVLPCPIAKGLAMAGKRGSTRQMAPEVLLINGPAYGEADLFTSAAQP